jgi:molybdopterin-guanine dinucleotide biosynthesis protein A
LAAGLAALEGGADAAFVSACDAPLLTAAFVRRVVEGIGRTRSVSDGVEATTPSLTLRVRPDAAVPRVGGFLHPLAAAYRLTVLPHVRQLLAANTFRLQSLFDHVPTRFLDADELPDLDSLRNLNTPDEYAAAVARQLPKEE